jgi:hypothetical protein
MVQLLPNEWIKLSTHREDGYLLLREDGDHGLSVLVQNWESWTPDSTPSPDQTPDSKDDPLMIIFTYHPKQLNSKNPTSSPSSPLTCKTEWKFYTKLNAKTYTVSLYASIPPHQRTRAQNQLQNT